MTLKNIKLIWLREVRDQLRDRRTLFMLLVLPMLLYPGLAIGMLQMTLLFTEQPRVVVLLGADELPELPLIEKGYIAPQWFFNAEHSKRLVLVTDSTTDNGAVAENAGVTSSKREEMLVVGRRVSELAQKRTALAERLTPFNAKIAAESKWANKLQLDGRTLTRPEDYDALVAEYYDVKKELSEEFVASKLQVLVVFPKDFGKTLAEVDRLLAEKDFRSELLHQLPVVRPMLIRNRASDKSDVAYQQVRDAIEQWEYELLRRRLLAANLPESLPDPVNPVSVDIAGQDEVANNVWSKLFPALLVLMALTGAFYPAIDVAAGEKERGTMETLLICPATRTEIVLGKFLTVLVFSVTTTVLNLISMGGTSRYIVSVTQGTSTVGLGNMPLPTPMAILWLMVLLLPLAALFSALCLALATFARSNKEGQYYLTPLFMVTMGLTMFAMSPSIELSPTASTSLFYCAMPLVGPAMLLKALLMNPNNTEVLVFALPVLMSSCVYGLLSLWWAVEQFKSEEVLFRESERFDLKLWLRHMLRDKDPTPSSGQAAACFILLMLLQFLSISVASKAFVGVPPQEMGMQVMALAMIQQVALIGSPAIFMALLLTSRARYALKLRLPSLKFVGAAIALPLILHPLAIELLSSLQQFFPQLPDSARAAFAAMSDDNLPFVFVLIAFALTPAICEELAFRGFILTGLSRGGRTWIAVGISSITFGIIHMIPQQVFNATLIGFVIGLLAVRSNSLWPGVLFHFCFNSLAVLHGRALKVLGSSEQTGVLRFFISTSSENGLRYQFSTLVLCALLAFVLLRWLIRCDETDSKPQPELALNPLPHSMNAKSI